jgi:undecaprenyl-phosphate 4-deoxy-4-formamido-L-arabinose transferase
MNSSTISVVVPVYNGEYTILDLFLGLKVFFEEHKLKFEVIFIHDCGPDNSLKILEQLQSHHPELIKVISLTRNYGQHNAIIAGIQHAKGEFILTMDEDLQHSPSDIKSLLKEQKEGDFDVVYGRYLERQHTSTRNLGSAFLKKMIAIGIPDIHHDYSAFRLIKSDIAKAMIEMHNSYTFIDGYISWITTNCSSCDVTHSERKGGKSAYNLKKLINHSINIFVTFSDLPLRLLTYFSLLIFTITSIFSFYIVVRKLVFDDFEMGYPSLIVSIGFAVSVIMLSLGVVGEYIYRINLKTTKKPNYIVKKIL